MRIKIEHRDVVVTVDGTDLVGGIPEGWVEVENLEEMTELLLKLRRVESERLEDGTLKLRSNTDYD